MLTLRSTRRRYVISIYIAVFFFLHFQQNKVAFEKGIFHNVSYFMFHLKSSMINRANVEVITRNRKKWEGDHKSLQLQK